MRNVIMRIMVFVLCTGYAMGVANVGHINKFKVCWVKMDSRFYTVKPRYNAVSGRHLLRPRYKRGAL